MIAKADLVHGAYYIGKSRGTSLARWNAKDDRFIYRRRKWGMDLAEGIRHADDEEIYDAFEPWALETTPPHEIPMEYS